MVYPATQLTDEAELEAIRTALLLDLILLALLVHLSISTFSQGYISYLVFFICGVGSSLFYASLTYWSLVSGTGRGLVSFSGPNVATRVIFWGIISLISRKVLHPQLKTRWLVFTGMFMFGAVLGIGSRGGIVAASVALGLLYLFWPSRMGLQKIVRQFWNWRSTRSKAALSLFANMFLVGFFATLLWLLWPTIEARVVNLLSKTSTLQGGIPYMEHQSMRFASALCLVMD